LDLGVSVFSASGLDVDGAPAEVTATGVDCAEDALTSIVDSSGFVEEEEEASLVGSMAVCGVGSGREVVLECGETGATEDALVMDSFTGCEGKVLDFGISAEAKADFSFDLSNIPEPILGRGN
jgi:hypothetical protein